MVSRSNGVSFLLGVATGVALTHPEVRRGARSLFRWAVQETVRLKVKLDAVAAQSGEYLENMAAKAEAARAADEAAASPSSDKGQ